MRTKSTDLDGYPLHQEKANAGALIIGVGFWGPVYHT